MSKLGWISDNDLINVLDELLDRSGNAIDESSKRLTKNVQDPFASLVMAKVAEITDPEVLHNLQLSISASQGISGAIGHFHQRILACVDGFVDHDTGYALENEQEKIIAEVKNKHNTMNATNMRKVVSDLETALRQKRGKWRGYLVIIVPKKPHRYTKSLSSSKNVIEIDGASFYELATGHKTALRDLYDVVEEMILEKHLKLGYGPKSNDVKLRNYCRQIVDNSLPK
ncbi:MAG: Eco47II family restriction endonuclease [Gammaproteobacteria bacterium]|nr:Eco47II family restriction endonuclease [Gammaproteobacteria bacterium]